MFKKGRERRQARRDDRKEKREERRDNRGARREGRGKPSNAAIGVGIGAATVATAAGVSAYKANQAKKAEAAAATKTSSYGGYSSDSSSESDFDDGFEITHLSEYTCLEVQYFFMAIGLENKCEVIEAKQITGDVLISLSYEQLEVELGCTSFEIKKISASIEFTLEITEGSNKDDETPTCKPPHSWTEAELCLVLVAIGMGGRIEKFKRNQITGAVFVSASSAELERECGMSSVEIKKVQVVIVKAEKGGCGIQPEVDTMPIKNEGEAQVESGGGSSGKIWKGAAIAGGVAIAGGIGYAAWKKNQNKHESESIKQEEAVTLPAPEEPQYESNSGGSSGGSLKPPTEWTKVEVKFFLLAIGFDECTCDKFEKNDINGKAMIKITKQELKVEYGCSSLEVKKFTAAIEFSLEVSENPGGCDKPPAQWTETEICLVLVMIGMGTKVRKFQRHHVSGAMIMSMTKAELEGLKKECGMSTTEVKAFKAVAVKCGHVSGGSSGGGSCGGSSSGGSYKKTTTVAAVSATAVGIHGSSGGGSCGKDEVEKPPMKHPCEWSKMECQYFFIAIGFSSKKCEKFKAAGVTGKKLVKMSSSELEEYGCSSTEIKTFKVAVAFSIEIVESNGCSKPAEKWTEIEVCMVMISIGLGTKVEKIDQHEITGAKVIKMDTIKLQNKCNMTGTQVTKFKAVVGIKVTETGKSHTGGGKPSHKGSPCSSRSSSPDSHCSRGSKGSHGSHHGKHGKAVKVTKTTVTKTTHYSKH